MADTSTFSTPGATTWTVPAGITSVSVVATGGGGGGGWGAAGGNGGVVTATLAVSPGQIMNIYVGGGGGGSASQGGGGGGSTNIDAGTINQIIAGGGGGGGGGVGGNGNGGNGGNAGAQGGFGGSNGVGGAGGANVGRPGCTAAVAGGNGNGGPGGIGGNIIVVPGGTAGTGAGSGTGGLGATGPGCGPGGGGGGYGGGGGGGGAPVDAGGGGGGSTGPAGTVYSLGTNAGPRAIAGGGGSVKFTYTVSAAKPLIPNLSTVTPVAGFSVQPTVLDLAGGSGPAMTTCLLATVRTIFGTDATYLGQTSMGAARISQGGRVFSFYPMAATDATNVPLNVNLRSSNLTNVGTSCGNFNVAPAIYSLIELGTTLNGLGINAQINAQGVVTFVVGTTVYVARPDYLLTTATGGPALTQGKDGLFSFIDSAGNAQILRPAFLDTDGLASQAPVALSQGGWLVIQTDGTALFAAFNGRRFLLTADLTLSVVPSANGSSLLWQDAPNHFMFRSGTLMMAQGFTVQEL